MGYLQIICVFFLKKTEFSDLQMIVLYMSFLFVAFEGYISSTFGRGICSRLNAVHVPNLFGPGAGVHPGEEYD